jgi:hypothetical protein
MERKFLSYFYVWMLLLRHTQWLRMAKCFGYFLYGSTWSTGNGLQVLCKYTYNIPHCISTLLTNNSLFCCNENSLYNKCVKQKLHILTHCGRVTQICVFSTVKLSSTPQGGMFPEVSHPQALLGSLVSIFWKFQFTKVVSEIVINF